MARLAHKNRPYCLVIFYQNRVSPIGPLLDKAALVLAASADVSYLGRRGPGRKWVRCRRLHEGPKGDTAGVDDDAGLAIGVYQATVFGEPTDRTNRWLRLGIQGDVGGAQAVRQLSGPTGGRVNRERPTAWPLVNVCVVDQELTLVGRGRSLRVLERGTLRLVRHNSHGNLSSPLTVTGGYRCHLQGQRYVERSRRLTTYRRCRRTAGDDCSAPSAVVGDLFAQFFLQLFGVPCLPGVIAADYGIPDDLGIEGLCHEVLVAAKDPKGDLDRWRISGPNASIALSLATCEEMLSILS